jgi:hypothetical protein
VTVDSDANASIELDGEAAGTVKANNFLRLNVLPGSHAVQATSLDDPSVTWRGVIDVVVGQARVLPIRLRPLFLVGSWKYTGPENETCRGSSVANTLRGAPRNVVLTVANDGERTTGRLSSAAGDTGRTTDYAADLLIMPTRDGYQASVTSARTKGANTNRGIGSDFVDLPSAVVSAVVMRSPTALEVNVSWSSGDDLYCTLVKQTPEALAAERQRLADEAAAERQRLADEEAARIRRAQEQARQEDQARQARLDRYGVFNGYWRSGGRSSQYDGDCSLNVETNQTLVFDPPTDRGITGRLHMRVSAIPTTSSAILGAFSGARCADRSAFKSVERTVRIRYDESRRVFSGETELVSCEGPCRDEDGTTTFTVQASQSSLRFSTGGGTAFVFTR